MRSIRETGFMRKSVVVASVVLLALQALPAAEAQTGKQKVNTRAGKRTYDQSCVQCHGEGKDGAPRLEVGFSRKNRNGDWTRRTFDANLVLSQHKEKGYVQIPAKSGDPQLADQDVINATHWMMIMLRKEPTR